MYHGHCHAITGCKEHVCENGHSCGMGFLTGDKTKCECRPTANAGAIAGAVLDTKDTPSCDAAKYMAAYPDLAQAFSDHADGGLAAAAQHWLNAGKGDGRTCPTGCDWKAYLARYADLEKAFGTDENKARTHYENSGMREGRHCGPSPQYCNWQNYLDRYADLAKAFGANNVKKAETHFMENGAQEGRNCM